MTTGHHFVSTWQVQAPIERGRKRSTAPSAGRAWWKHVARVEELEPVLPTVLAGACACSRSAER